MKRFAGCALFMMMLLPTIAVAQSNIITGRVRNSSTADLVSAVSVTVKGTDYGTFTDDKGAYRLVLPATVKFPVTLVFTSVGYEFSETVVSSAGDAGDARIAASAALGQEVVISATRMPTRILESPVSIERVSNTQLRNAPAANYYDVVANLKGVDVITSSLTFKTVTTRGFAGSGNTRFNQIVDGMDNQAPGLNFSVGSVIGLTELDVESMELLPGASSALYGPGGMNGTLIINSKNPFKYQGLSFQIKEGIMHTDGKYRQPSPYHNWNLRWAKTIGNRFAFKINSEFIQAKDWLAADYRNVLRNKPGGELVPGTRDTDPNYDGVNMYGDETTIDLRQVLTGIAGAAPFLAPYIATLSTSAIPVSRTGYTEKETTDPNTINFKLAGAMHYKINSTTEAIVAGFWGTGNTVYTGSDRYSLRDLKMGQYKVELNSKNWFWRAFTTQENAGQSYNTTITSRIFNESWKRSQQWYTEYGQAYLNGKLNGLDDMVAHNQARSVADIGRPVAGSSVFNKKYDSVRLRPISQGGGLFIDRTNLYATEAQYNLTHLTGEFAEVLVGANYRKFVLNSEGTLFADSAGTIPINEYGGYIQIMKPMFNEFIRVTLSGRYDKNSNFKGRFTPRAMATFKVAANNHIRLSFQTAYRFPSTQQQWINLEVGGATLLGGVPQLKEFYGFDTNPVYSFTELQQQNLKVQEFGEFKPEAVTSFEVGYKGLLMQNKLLIDAYGYFGQYQDFISRILVLQSITSNPQPSDILVPSRRRVLSVPVNTPEKVKTYGFGVGLEYRFNRGYFTNFNFGSDVLSDLPEGYIANFNTPRYRANLIVGNNAFGKSKRIGFNVAFRWQDEVVYESDLANGTVPPIYILDAQLSYRFPTIKSVVKIGANNLLNDYYYNAMANPSVGGLYYVAFGYNIF